MENAVAVEEVKGEPAAPVVSPEQAADLAALHAAAAEDQAAAPPEMAGPEMAGPDLAGELTGLILLAAKLVTPIFPSVAGIYTDETAGAAGAAVAEVCNKYGWMQNGFVGEWGPEIGCAVVVLPLAIATSNAVKADLAEQKRKADYIAMKKQADLRQHMNIAHNLDGKTEPVAPGHLQGWVPPAGGASANE